MKLVNDLKLAGIPSSYGWDVGTGRVIMGNDPRGTRTPTWWQPANTYYKSGAWWNTVLPWFVIFDGVGNQASYTRVEIRNIKAYARSKSTKQWKLLGASPGVSGYNYPKHLQGNSGGTPDQWRLGDGSTSILPPGGDTVYHGWYPGRIPIDAPDLDALFVTLEARLAVGTHDDRAKAKYLVQVGADYYPDSTVQVTAFAPSSYNPGVGLSRSKLVSNEWQSFNFATIAVGVQDPGGAAISEADFRANPPPL